MCQISLEPITIFICVKFPYFLLFSKHRPSGFWVFLVHLSMASVLLSASVKMLCLPYAGFFLKQCHNFLHLVKCATPYQKVFLCSMRYFKGCLILLAKKHFMLYVFYKFSLKLAQRVITHINSNAVIFKSITGTSV